MRSKPSEFYRVVFVNHANGYKSQKANAKHVSKGFQYLSEEYREDTCNRNTRTIKTGDVFTHIMLLDNSQSSTDIDAGNHNIYHGVRTNLAVNKFEDVLLQNYGFSMYNFARKMAMAGAFERFSMCERFSRSTRAIKLMQQSPETCYISGEKIIHWRTGGENTFRETSNGLESMQDKILSIEHTYGMSRCNHCDKYVIDMDNYICSECREKATECNTCSNLNYTGSTECNTCEDYYGTDLHSYGENPPQFLFYDWCKKTKKHTMSKTEKNPNALKFGIELEVESEYDRDEDCEIIRTGGRDLRLYNSRDGSLDCGIEIHTHAMSYEAMQNVNWQPFAEIQKNGCKSYRTTTAGLHVHLSRNAFTLFHWLRFVSFFYKNMGLTNAIMRRRNYQNLNRYAKFDSREIAHLRRAVKRAKRNGGNIKTLSMNSDKSRAFNYNHGETFELRFFGGSLNERKFKAKIEFLQAVYELTKYGYGNAKRFKTHVKNAVGKFPHLNKEFNTPEFKRAFQYPKTTHNEINI